LLINVENIPTGLIPRGLGPLNAVSNVDPVSAFLFFFFNDVFMPFEGFAQIGCCEAWRGGSWLVLHVQSQVNHAFAVAELSVGYVQ
jgi:hypothetical protein